MSQRHRTSLTLADLRHPDYLYDSLEWTEWRDTFRGGQEYLDLYLQKFSERETEYDYQARKNSTPIPTFAKAALLDIRNSIFQRLEDITRIGGSSSYQRATKGEDVGVDRKGSSMNSFIGIDVLTELLVMGRVGVFVDAPSVTPTTLADGVAMPYLYYYRVEDILSWTLEDSEEPGQFKAVLLRDTAIQYNTEFGGISLPEGRQTRYRLVWKDEDTGLVKFRLYDSDKNVIYLPGSDETGSVTLNITIVPFIMPSIGDSLLKDVASYQKALLNLVSGDVNWALKSNLPFLTIQQELRTTGAHLKKPGDAATPGSQPARNAEERVGNAGRYYDVGMERPGFIAPPTDPLEASMKLQEKLEDDIRKLINLAVSNKVGSRTESAEAKKLSSQGLEAGLSYIGLVLQQTEQKIAQYWAMYENTDEVAKISYPSRYILKEDKDRIEEADALLNLMLRIPGNKAKKVIAKQIIIVLFSGKQDNNVIQAILEDIDNSQYVTSDITFILEAQKAGLVGNETASKALGFAEGEVEKAEEDRAKRAIAILAAQTSFRPDNNAIKNPASRGVPELDANPASGEEEQEQGREEPDE